MTGTLPYVHSTADDAAVYVGYLYLPDIFWVCLCCAHSTRRMIALERALPVLPAFFWTTQVSRLADSVDILYQLATARATHRYLPTYRRVLRDAVYGSPCPRYAAFFTVHTSRGTRTAGLLPVLLILGRTVATRLHRLLHIFYWLPGFV